MHRLLYLIFTLNIMILPVFSPAVEQPLVIGCPNTFTPLDPLASSSLQNRMALSLIFEPLVRMNGKQELEPVLASNWTVAADKKSIRMNLKPGLLFSDGSSLNATSVKRALVEICHKGSAAANDLAGLVGCASQNPSKELRVKVLSHLELEFQIAASPTLFLYQLSSSRAGIFRPLPDGKRVGSGPYVVISETPAELSLAPNSRFRSLNAVRNSGLRLIHLDETKLQESVSALKPDATLMFRVSTLQGFSLSDYRIEDEASNITMKLVLNTQKFPFNHSLARQAIATEIYNQDQVHRCLPESEKAYGIIPTGMGGSRAHTAPAKLPPISAEEVWKAVPQLRAGARVSLHRHRGRKNDCEEAAVIKAMAKYGIEATMVYHEDYKKLFPLYLNHSLDGFFELFVYENREAYTKLIYYLSDGAENFANLKPSKLDELIRSSWASTTSLARFKKYGEVNDEIITRSLVVPLYYTRSRNLVHRCLVDIPADFRFNPFLGLWQIGRQRECQQ